MCVLQDFEALTPNLLARTIETVEGGGSIIILLKVAFIISSSFGFIIPKRKSPLELAKFLFDPKNGQCVRKQFNCFSEYFAFLGYFSCHTVLEVKNLPPNISDDFQIHHRKLRDISIPF